MLAGSEMWRPTSRTKKGLWQEGQPFPDSQQVEQSYSPKELDSANNLNELGYDSSQSHLMGVQPLNILISASYDPEQRNDTSQLRLVTYRTVK